MYESNVSHIPREEPLVVTSWMSKSFAFYNSSERFHIDYRIQIASNITMSHRRSIPDESPFNYFFLLFKSTVTI